MCSANVKDYSVIVVIKSLLERCIHFISKTMFNLKKIENLLNCAATTGCLTSSSNYTVIEGLAFIAHYTAHFTSAARI